MSPQIKAAIKRAAIVNGFALAVAVATALSTDPTYGVYAGIALSVLGRLGEGWYDETRDKAGDIKTSDVGSRFTSLQEGWRSR